MTSAKLKAAQDQLKAAKAAVERAKTKPGPKPVATPPPPLTRSQRLAIEDARQSLIGEIEEANRHGLSVGQAMKKHDPVLGTPEKMRAAMERYEKAVAALKKHDGTFADRMRIQ
jgi:hypothetical protein